MYGISRVGEELVDILIGEGYLEYARVLGLINECKLKEILGIFKLGEYVYTLSRGRGGGRIELG